MLSELSQKKNPYRFLKQANQFSSPQHKPQTLKLKSDSAKDNEKDCAILHPKVTQPSVYFSLQ